MSAFAPKADKQIDALVRQLCATTGREEMQQSICKSLTSAITIGTPPTPRRRIFHARQTKPTPFELMFSKKLEPVGTEGLSLPRGALIKTTPPFRSRSVKVVASPRNQQRALSTQPVGRASLICLTGPKAEVATSRQPSWEQSLFK
jgi:hypothetical protein